MDQNTLTFYSLAAGLCFCLSLVLLGYAHLQRGTVLIRSTAQTMLVLAVAFYFAGHAPVLPNWISLVGTNMLLLGASVVFTGGVRAYLRDSAPRFDRGGALFVALTLPLFVWWGLIEPHGIMRSIVFSLASGALNGRIAWLLYRLIRQGLGGLPAKLLALLFAAASLWMLLRAGMLALADAAPPAQRGSNPTTWITVFWFNVLVASITATLLALEMHRFRRQQMEGATQTQGQGLESGRQNLLLLWTLVTVIALTILAEVGIAYSVLYQREYRQLQERTQLANRAFVDHTQQVIAQVDILIRAVRSLLERGTPPAELENFVGKLGFPHDLIENIYVIDAHGEILLPLAARSKGPIDRERDYFRFHRDHPQDELFIGQVMRGLVTGKQQFRLSRRLDGAAGRFAGVVLAPLEPQAFAQLYRRLLVADDAVALLLGLDDRKLRAQAGDFPAEYAEPLDDAALWQAFAEAPQGSYTGENPHDGVARHLAYQRVGELPLVMVSGFSSADVRRNTVQSILPIGLGALLALLLVFSLAAILTATIRRRDEQEHFVSMLGHELKTPLSVIRMTINGEPVAAASATRINRAIREMQNVIERCVQADKLGNGLIAPRRTQVDLAALLQSLCAESGLGERIALTHGALPACHCDRQLLEVILANLVDNAAKYGKSGGAIRIEAMPRTHKRRAGVALVVSNRPGPAGFPDPGQVFRKYYRAPAAHGKTGSGLGLHIAAGFARLLGGRLAYVPDDAQVRFELWLPC